MNMNIDLKIGWNDLNANCKDMIKKLHKLGCKVNIIYPMIESGERNNYQSNTSENRFYDRNSSDERTFTRSVNDFIYQNSAQTEAMGGTVS